METKTCPKCGQDIPAEAEDCPFCGIVLAKFRPGTDPGDSPEPGPSEASASGTAAPSAARSATEPSSRRPAPDRPEADAGPDAGPGGLYDPDAPPPVFTRPSAGGDFGDTPTGGAGGLVPAENPYGPVTETMVEHLSRTGPWVVLMAVITFLSAVMIAFSAVVVMSAAGRAGLPAVPLFLTYAVLGILYLVFALQLFNFGQAARQVGQGEDTHYIEEALRYQRSFWRLLGILTLIGLALGILLIGLGFFFSLMPGAGAASAP
jgi:uncharacterized integral membrane protein